MEILADLECRKARKHRRPLERDEDFKISGSLTLLANRDARTEVTSFQVYNFKVRAQIGTSNVEN